ncbi:hydrolase [Anaerocolumna cellulosilytica]|uniref:Hydrolase n=1 Tax=Anaerocolumna cellulosilytica TaxID=433286 RepID=A0A6S6QNR5_9FIRM|nr:Cof-type HAD-IIB family hydrolase [Anaerocolumna cellulosilytica]MBB5195671.1 hypothetical protein [Anaerocolumna cellulosilytica]BCJ92993.1 hydrolase [Anaerocolumna cellulosilytica]
MESKIVFFDIDGTLYDPVIGVPESTKEALKLLTQNGHMAIICTGRTKAIIPENIKNLGFSGIVAGAGTYVEYKSHIIHHKVEGADFAKDILALLKENGIKFIVEGPEYVYYDGSDQSKEYEMVKNELNRIGIDMRALEFGDYRLNKITCHIPKSNSMEAILPKIKEKFHLIWHQSGKFVELVPLGYTKATGIEYLLSYLDRDRKDTYAFGDSTNDIEMLEYVNYGIAMGNSYPEVLKKARYKTKSIMENGIFYGLKEFGLI